MRVQRLLVRAALPPGSIPPPGRRDKIFRKWESGRAAELRPRLPRSRRPDAATAFGPPPGHHAAHFAGTSSSDRQPRTPCPGGFHRVQSGRHGRRHAPACPSRDVHRPRRSGAGAERAARRSGARAGDRRVDQHRSGRIRAADAGFRSGLPRPRGAGGDRRGLARPDRRLDADLGRRGAAEAGGWLDRHREPGRRGALRAGSRAHAAAGDRRARVSAPASSGRSACSTRARFAACGR